MPCDGPRESRTRIASGRCCVRSRDTARMLCFFFCFCECVLIRRPVWGFSTFLVTALLLLLFTIHTSYAQQAISALPDCSRGTGHIVSIITYYDTVLPSRVEYERKGEELAVEFEKSCLQTLTFRMTTVPFSVKRLAFSCLGLS